jgi:tetratricopeptide (TPR) repeat protein
MLTVALMAVPVAGFAQKQDATARAQAAYAAAYKALTEQHLDEAQRDFAEVVRLAPQLPEGHNGLGFVLLHTGHPKEAAVEFEKALKIAKSQPAEESLGEAYAALQEPSRAAAALQRAAAMGTLSPEAVLLDARLLSDARQQDEAITQLRRTIDRTPTEVAGASEAARMQLAQLHDALGALLAGEQQWTEAQAQLELATQMEDLLPSAQEHLGALLLAQSHPDLALPHLQKAVELQPDDAEGQVELGRALMALHRDDDALEAMRRAEALSQKPGTPADVRTDALFQLGLALQNTPHPGDSIPYFEKVVQAQPNNGPALVNLGLALVQTGKSKEATPYYLRALQVEPKDATLRLDLGVDYLQTSDLDDAVDQFKAGIALDPDNAELHYDLGLALKLKDKLDACIPELQKALELDPTLVDPHVTLGTLYMQQGKFDQAAVEMQAVLQAQPDNGDMWATLGSVYKQAEKLPQAEEALRRAIALLPDQPGAHTTLASVLQEEGRTQEALAERKQAGILTRGAMNRQAALFATNAGDLLLSKGQLDEAIAQYRTAIKDDPNYAPAHKQLAVALEQKGQPAEAAAERKLAAQDSGQATGANAAPRPE